MLVLILVRSSREEGNDTGRSNGRPQVVSTRAEVLQDVKTKDDGEEEEERIVVEDAEVGGLEVGHFGLLEKNSVVFFLLYGLLHVTGGISNLLHDFSCYTSVSSLGYLVFK